MTFINNGFTEYRVVQHTQNVWNSDKTKQDVFITQSLYEAYQYILKEEGYLNALSYHNAGDPTNVTFKIDIYLNQDCV